MGLNPRAGRALRTLVTSVASDAHTWNLLHLQLVIEEMGHQVVNLGACVPDATLVAECLARPPDLVVVSTVNGHGAHDGLHLIRALRDHPRLPRFPVVIGGRLGTDGIADPARTRRLLDAGFDGVFDAGADLSEFRFFVDALASRLATTGSWRG
ncbi:cobalamin B12-binding domain-containing protein [Streptosporangium sp. KLBMP 9127]|nr:cobalamin B12-binding domain-containing protein [Streptosporangium sp. KLBMP 9127]